MFIIGKIDFYKDMFVYNNEGKSLKSHREFNCLCLSFKQEESLVVNSSAIPSQIIHLQCHLRLRLKHDPRNPL